MRGYYMKKLRLLLLSTIVVSNLAAMHHKQKKSWFQSITSSRFLLPGSFLLAGIGYCFWKPESAHASWNYIKEIPFPIKCAVFASTSYVLINDWLNKKRTENH